MQDHITHITQRLNSTKIEHYDNSKISEDKSTLILGFPAMEVALIFTHQKGEWVFQQELVARSCDSGDWFGWSVSLSSDGSTALVCAHRENDFTGAAYVFTRNGSTWTEQAKLVASDGVSGDGYGNSMSLSADGSTALIGAHRKSSSTGAAYVFTRSGDTWTEQQKLTAPDGVDIDFFGRSVSLSSDGALAKILNGFDKEYVFTLTDGVWRTPSLNLP